MDFGETHLWTQQVKVLYGEELSGVDSSSTWFMSVTRLWASLLSAVYRRIFSSFLAVSPMDCAILRLQSLMGEKFSVKRVAVLKSSLSFGHELLSCYRLFPTERPTWKCAKLWLWPQTSGTMLRSLQTLTVKHHQQKWTWVNINTYCIRHIDQIDLCGFVSRGLWYAWAYLSKLSRSVCNEICSVFTWS